MFFESIAVLSLQVLQVLKLLTQHDHLFKVDLSIRFRFVAVLDERKISQMDSHVRHQRKGKAIVSSAHFSQETFEVLSISSVIVQSGHQAVHSSKTRNGFVRNVLDETNELEYLPDVNQIANVKVVQSREDLHQRIEVVSLVTFNGYGNEEDNSTDLLLSS